MATPPGVAWLPWTERTFARAAREGKPVLLSITAAWCGHSGLMDRLSYGDPRVAELIRTLFVPVRVDADRRPDVSARYGLGGWPTTAFLTPGGDILGGGTYVQTERLVEVLGRVSAAFAAEDHARAPPSQCGPPEAGPSSSFTDAALVAQVAGGFDSLHGGFGGAPKFPHIAPVRLALALHEEDGSPEWRDRAARSLDAMGWGPLYDEAHGGFFRHALHADWSSPCGEKLLETNAGLLSLYVTAFEVLGQARYAERAEDVLRYIQTWLADTLDGGWGASQGTLPPHDTPAVPQGSASSAVATSAAPVDTTLYTDWNALMVSAALHAGRTMNDPSLSEFAIRSLERVGLEAYRPGGGVAHAASLPPGIGVERGHGDGEIRGLLDDQIAMALAHLDAFEATGNIVYQMMAEELALYAVRTMWDEAGGGFFDHAPNPAGEIGLLRERLKPFVSNCTAARMLGRLARVSGTGEYAAYAGRTLQALNGRAGAEGPLAAEYLLAVRALAQG